MAFSIALPKNTKPIQKPRLVLIREELVALTGDHTKAVLLNQFIYWSARVRDFHEFIAEEKLHARKPDAVAELTHGWIFKTAKELSIETMLCLAHNTIARHVKVLIKNGWLSERNNPVYKWDRTKQYRVNLLKIHEDLKKLGYSLNYKINIDAFAKIENRETQNGQSNVQNGQAIPETTTKRSVVVEQVKKVILGNKKKPSLVPRSKEQDKDKMVQEVCKKVQKTAGASISAGFVREIIKKHSLDDINNAILDLSRQLKRGIRIRNVGGWLRHFLQNGYKPGQSATTMRKRQTTRPRKNRSTIPLTENEKKERAFLRSLYNTGQPEQPKEVCSTKEPATFVCAEFQGISRSTATKRKSTKSVNFRQNRGAFPTADEKEKVFICSLYNTH